MTTHAHRKDQTHYETQDMTSVVSAPIRGPWGDRRYRGNCDGTLIKDLIVRYRPKRVADPMEGSGTARDVVTELNQSGQHISYWGADLRADFDLSVERLPGVFDFVWVHPPYWNMIRYSDDRRDLSTAKTYPEFVVLLERCLRHCAESLAPGGRLAVLVGDIRRRGCYIPIVRDVLAMERELGQLRGVIIKTQHNCQSDAKRYPNLEDPRIAHEYCIIFKRAYAAN